MQDSLMLSTELYKVLLRVPCKTSHKIADLFWVSSLWLYCVYILDGFVIDRMSCVKL